MSEEIMDAAQVVMANGLLDKHGLSDAGWQIIWDNDPLFYGACTKHSKTINLSYVLLDGKDDVEVREVVLHEIAHALAPNNDHGSEWLEILVSIGGDEDYYAKLRASFEE